MSAIKHLILLDDESQYDDLTLALDPGAYTGWAVFCRGVLVACGLIEPLKGERPPELPDGRAYQHLVVEMPRIYPKTSVGGANDIVTLAFRLGRLVESVRADTTEAVNPSVWKGSLPKDVHQERIKAKLSTKELAIIPKMSYTKVNNVIDAIGLGCWKVGR